MRVFIGISTRIHTLGVAPLPSSTSLYCSPDSAVRKSMIRKSRHPGTAPQNKPTCFCEALKFFVGELICTHQGSVRINPRPHVTHLLSVSAGNTSIIHASSCHILHFHQQTETREVRDRNAAPTCHCWRPFSPWLQANIEVRATTEAIARRYVPLGDGQSQARRRRLRQACKQDQWRKRLEIELARPEWQSWTEPAVVHPEMPALRSASPEQLPS